MEGSNFTFCLKYLIALFFNILQKLTSTCTNHSFCRVKVNYKTCNALTPKKEKKPGFKNDFYMLSCRRHWEKINSFVFVSLFLLGFFFNYSLIALINIEASYVGSWFNFILYSQQVGGSERYSLQQHFQSTLNINIPLI